mgnify:CR=1 FL=1
MMKRVIIMDRLMVPNGFERTNLFAALAKSSKPS